jgi:hypothetical protein
VGYTLMLSRQCVAPLEGERADWNTTSKCHARRLGRSVLPPLSSQAAVVQDNIGGASRERGQAREGWATAGLKCHPRSRSCGQASPSASAAREGPATEPRAKLGRWGLGCICVVSAAGCPRKQKLLEMRCPRLHTAAGRAENVSGLEPCLPIGSWKHAKICAWKELRGVEMAGLCTRKAESPEGTAPCFR